MKKIVLCLISIVSLLMFGSMAVLAGEGTKREYDRLISEIPEDADAETAVLIEKRNSKNLTCIQMLFDKDSFKAYSKLVSTMKKEGTIEAVEAAVEARNNLIQLETMEDRAWFIWDGVGMPCVDGEEYTEEDLDASQMFGYGYETVAIKYLVEDQSQCKGNIIACSGGAMKVWSNNAEGYPAAEVFNELGYNFFLLQRRVEPYSDYDIFMDFQRLIRVVKYHAELEGYGGQDMYIGLGWSGGGWTLNGTICNFYGDITPASVDSDYVPDDIDAINSDLDVALCIYSSNFDYETLNDNLPAYYIVHGSADTTVDPQNSITLYEFLTEKGIKAELNMIEGAEHGFGVGLSPATGQAPGTDEWPAEADRFIQELLLKS